jgi:outer membrane assembly lipoprotein YfiO
MKLTVRFYFLCVILLGTWSCVQKSAKLQKSAVPPDKTLFETGSDYLKKGQFIKARLANQTLINTYPDSDLAAEAYFAIAESYYEEGGTENLLSSEDQFNSFIVFFPTHPKAVEAMLKNLSANMKMMHAPDRDQTYARKALTWADQILKQHPESDFVPIVRGHKREIEEHLSLSELGVAQFYGDKNILGANGRYKTIIDNYPEFSHMDDVYFKYASNLEKMKNPEGASAYYAKIASGFPFSKHFEPSKQRLLALNKPVPSVDDKLADLNKSRIKIPKGFSPTDIFVELGKTLGFIGPPDSFDAAKKKVEDEKSKNAAASGDKSGAGKNGDALIRTILKQDASGKIVEDSTVAGSDTNSTQPNDVEKKKVINKNKRQGGKKVE